MRYKLFHGSVVLFSLLLLWACANIGRPTGGEKDMKPPILLRTIPAENSTNVTKRTIQLEFNELISVEKAFEQVVVSPPQKEAPIVLAAGRKVIAELKDTLLPNKTYIIDFASSIVDYNEANPFGSYTFSFSTGATIDTLEIAGRLIDAFTLNPLSGVLVGLYPADESFKDSIFITTPFERVAKSGSDGKFCIKGIAAGRYKVFAVDDVNRDNRFDSRSEQVAFFDSIYAPSIIETTGHDTIWKDSLTVDSIVTKPFYQRHPNDLLLRVFKHEENIKYFIKAERKQREKFTLYFNGKHETSPQIRFLDEGYRVEREFSHSNDTLTFWLRDSVAFAQDTIRAEVSYLKTDSVGEDVLTQDTVNLYFKNIAPTKKSKRAEAPAAAAKQLEAQLVMPQLLDIYRKPLLQIAQPVDTIDHSKIRVYHKKDTTWLPHPARLRLDTTRFRSFFMEADWKPGGEYKVAIDSAAIRSIYGAVNNKIEQSCKLKNVEDYSNLFVSIVGSDHPLLVELLDAKEGVVMCEPVIGGTAEFWYITPATYYLKVIEDSNNNKRWDPGDYLLHRQPERVFYYNKELLLRANWDVEERWDVSNSRLEDKPEVLKKNSANKGNNHNN